MFSRPTTDQVILDCRNELLNAVDSAVSDPTVKITIQMLENVLRNVAERAAQEIAWMHEETDLMIGFANEVQSTLGASPELTLALQAFATAFVVQSLLPNFLATNVPIGN